MSKGYTMADVERMRRERYERLAMRAGLQQVEWPSPYLPETFTLVNAEGPVRYDGPVQLFGLRQSAPSEPPAPTGRFQNLDFP